MSSKNIILLLVFQYNIAVLPGANDTISSDQTISQSSLTMINMSKNTNIPVVQLFIKYVQKQ